MAVLSLTRLLTLTLASLATISALPTELTKRGEVLIGYRGATKDQTEAYKKAGNTLVYVVGSIAKQIGDGVYLSSTIGGTPDGSTMFCEIYADEAEFKALNRIWVPKSLDNKYLGKPLKKVYSGIDKQVIEDMGWTVANADPYKVMEVMKISRPDWQSTQPYQLVIPEQTLSHNGGPLKTRVVCKESRAELGTKPIDMTLWTHNAKGTPQA